MAELKSANSARPGSLNKPVPGAQEQDAADAFLASFDAPEAPAQADEADAFVGGFDEPNAVLPEAQDFPVQEPSSTMGVNTDLAQQLQDMPVRIQANLAGDPASVKLTLAKRLGPENVKEKGGEIYFKQPGDKAFRKLDPNTFEVLNDTFSDMYKEYIAMMGAGAGAIAGAPLGPAGAVGGGIGGYAAAKTGVEAAAQASGAVVKSPDSYVTETAKEDSLMGTGARLAENVGGALKEGAEFEMLNGIFKGISDKFRARREATAGIRQLKEVPPSERLQESVKVNMETLDEMRRLGLTTRIQGTNLEVPAHQLLPHLPEVGKISQSVAADKAFQQVQKEAAENFGQASLNLVEEAAGLTKGNLNKIVRTGVPIEKQVNAADINGLFRSVRRAEGQVIEEFRNLAKDTAKKSPLPAPKTTEAVQTIFGNLGIRMRDGKLMFPPDDALAQTLGTDSKAYISGLKADLRMLNGKLMKGGLNLDELIGQSKIIGAKNDGARTIGGQYKSIIGKLSSAIREDSRNGVKMVLDPENAIAYDAKMNRFGSIAKSMEQLEGYLRDDIGMNTFAKGLVSKGKEGLPTLRAAKEFLLQENPDMYKSLTGQFFEELALKHRVPGEVAGFNPAAMRKELASYGSEYLAELFPKSSRIDKGLVLRSFDLADQIQRSIIKGTDDELRKDARQGFRAMSAWARTVNAVSALGHLGTKNGRLLKMISREGVESFLTDVPKSQKGPIREAINGALQLARQNGTLKTIRSQIPPALAAGTVSEGYNQ